MASNDRALTNGPAIRRLELLIEERDRYYNQRFEAAKEAVNLALSAAEKAVAKAEAASEKRQDASNEIRAAMMDQQKNFPQKGETVQRFESIEKRLDELSSYRLTTTAHGKGMTDLWGWIVAAITAVGAYIHWALSGK